MEKEEFAYVSTSTCNDQHGSQEKNDMDAFLVIGRHGWDVDNCFIQGDRIYDTDTGSPVIEFSELMHLGKPNMVEVCKPFSLVDEQPYPLTS